MTQPYTLRAACDEVSDHNNITQPYAAMPSLLLVVFVLQFVLHIINTVGANTVNELVSPASILYSLKRRADTSC